MKNKILLLACAVIVMMLCACQPLNVSSVDSDVVTVAFRVAGEGVQAKAITIGNPEYGSNVIYQYKAIPGFAADKIVGATGDVWTDFPTVYNGSEFKMKFSKGPWTFYVRGVDKTDLTPLYKIAAPVKVKLVSKSIQDIVFNMEEDPEGISAYNEVGNGLGTISLNIIAQSNDKEGILLVDYSPVGIDDFKKLPRFENPEIVDGNKTIFTGNVSLASGFYNMNFYYIQDGKSDLCMMNYLVKVVANRTTTITGKIATRSQFVTYFSGNGNKYRATFNATAIEPLKKNLVINNNAEKALNDAINANNILNLEQIAQEQAQQPANEVRRAPNNAEKQLNEKQAEEKQKQILPVIGNINFTLQTVIEKENLQKKIGIRKLVVCDGKTYDLYATDKQDKSLYWLGDDNNGAHFSLSEELFKEVAKELNMEYSPEHVITLKVIWENNGTILHTAESEPITVLFIHED